MTYYVTNDLQIAQFAGTCDLSEDIIGSFYSEDDAKEFVRMRKLKDGTAMNYHNITKDDMLNGMGLRVVLWVSGCRLHCKNCQNPETHPLDSGIPFDEAAEEELFEALDKPYISGITFSGGHPLEPENRPTILRLINKVKGRFPDKDIWLYTGYKYEDIMHNAEIREITDQVDVLCDGPFIEALKDNNLEWVGSSNQRVLTKQDRKELENSQFGYSLSTSNKKPKTSEIQAYINRQDEVNQCE